MRKEKVFLNKRVNIFVSQQDYNELKQAQENSTCPSMSFYLRKRLYSQKIVSTIRNRSQDDILEEISKIRMTLESINEKTQESTTSSSPNQIKDNKRVHELIDKHMQEFSRLVKKLLTLWLE